MRNLSCEPFKTRYGISNPLVGSSSTDCDNRMHESLTLKYRMKAAELRAIAEDDSHSRTRDQILRIAEEYERIAESFEKFEPRDSPLN